MPFEAAAQMEKELAEDLRAEGYTGYGRNVMVSRLWRRSPPPESP
jgi:hypothetical protein